MTPTRLGRGLISVAGIYLIAAGLITAAAQHALNGAVLIAAPLLILGGGACLAWVARLNERGAR